MKMKNKADEYVIYLVWDNRNDYIIAHGTAQQCAKNLNMTANNFRAVMSHVKNGTNKKYSFVKEIIKKEDYLL